MSYREHVTCAILLLHSSGVFGHRELWAIQSILHPVLHNTFQGLAQTEGFKVFTWTNDLNHRRFSLLFFWEEDQVHTWFAIYEFLRLQFWFNQCQLHRTPVGRPPNQYGISCLAITRHLRPYNSTLQLHLTSKESLSGEHYTRETTQRRWT